MIEKPAYQLIDEVVYPEYEGRPIAENMRQFRYIVTIQGGLDALFFERDDVLVAGNLLWFPVEGEPGIRRAPDVLVAFGRPKGDRTSYKQWLEGGIAPQVVWEILSPSNTLAEMAQKLAFYDRYGVEEYYLYDPDKHDLAGWQRIHSRLEPVAVMQGWISPRLGVRFDLSSGELQLYQPDGEPFLTYIGLRERERAARQRVAQEQQRVAQEQQRVAQEQQRVAQEQQRVARLAAQLRALGVEPDDAPQP